MAYRNLTIAEMVSTTTPWVTPGHPERDVLRRLSLTAPLLPEVDAAHGDVVYTHTATVELSKLLAGLTAEATIVDGDHDGWARAIDSVFAGLIHANLTSTGDASLVANLRALRDKLFPLGMRIVTASYREEAGQGELTAARLTAEDRALLAGIRVAEGSLLDWVNTWIKKALRLGEIEDLRAIKSSKEPQPSPADAVRARHHWIRVVKAVMLMLELAGREDAEVQDIIDRVREIERQADRRASTGDTMPEPDEEPARPDASLEMLAMDAAPAGGPADESLS
jgi:hypothetical protein